MRGLSCPGATGDQDVPTVSNRGMKPRRELTTERADLNQIVERVSACELCESSTVGPFTEQGGNIAATRAIFEARIQNR